MYSDFHSLNREKERVRQTDDMEGRWKRKVVPVVGDSWVRARPFVPSQKPCGAEVGDMTRCENNNTPWQNSSLCQHPPKPQEWGTQATPVTPNATMGEHQQPTTTLNLSSNVSVLNSFSLIDRLFFGSAMRVPFKDHKPADSYVERRWVLKI